MFKGTVNFRAKIKGNGLTFPSVEFNPNEPSVEKVEIEGPKGDEIQTTVYLASVVSHDEGRTLAAKVNTVAMNRVSFNHSIAIGNAHIAGEQFFPLNPKPGVLEVASVSHLLLIDEVTLVLGISAAHLKAELEQPTSSGENYFGLFRSARQSLSPVEEFMHLYNILLMIHNDNQAEVDSFIISKDPTVPQTQSPRKGPGCMETVYTRLRNEFAHTRANVNLDNTKSEMANRLGGLLSLTKQAIELNP